MDDCCGNCTLKTALDGIVCCLAMALHTDPAFQGWCMATLGQAVISAEICGLEYSSWDGCSNENPSPATVSHHSYTDAVFGKKLPPIYHVFPCFSHVLQMAWGATCFSILQSSQGLSDARGNQLHVPQWCERLHWFAVAELFPWQSDAGSAFGKGLAMHHRSCNAPHLISTKRLTPNTIITKQWQH